MICADIYAYSHHTHSQQIRVFRLVEPPPVEAEPEL